MHMKRNLTCLLALTLLLTLALPAAATEPDPVEIHTVEDLLAIRENPCGSYLLMADLDLSGVAWTALDFSGIFDGNGHAILNLTITDPGEEKPDSCDGNRKLYETTYFGLFGTARNATVCNLSLLNVRAVIDWDSPVFLAAIAGYAENCTIRNCTVTGILELRAHDRMFGVGGLVGYGSGTVEDCSVDVTLINTDTDEQSRDEQFLGGIYATGFMDVLRCDVTLDGYVSDHGYVHSGGIVGMYMEYPLGIGMRGYVKENRVTGKITFFEDNYDRRAYCDAFVGEALVGRWYLDNNTGDFLRDEQFTYDVELRPETCAQPDYREEVTAPGCDSYGYTTYTCQGCGWSHRDHYTLPEHIVTEWTLTKAPTPWEEGLSTGYCPCGQEFTRTEPVLETEPTTAPTTQPATRVPDQTQAPAAPQEPEADNLFFILVAVDTGLLLLAVVLIICLVRSRRRRR